MDYTEYTTKTSEEVLRKFSTTQSGLTSQEAQNRRKIYGQNILSAKEVHWYFSLLRQFQSPFLYLLVGAGLLSFFLRETLDGFMIFLFIAINSILGFIQEYRSEKTLQLLKQYVVAKTKVYRDGKEEIITSAVLVPGDVILIKPGDILPADIRFLATENILLDESVLTGESVAITKTADALSTEAKEIYQAKNIGFSGTHVVSGEGKGLVIGTGKNTAIGNISSLTAETKHTSSFEKEIGKLSSFVLKLILLTIALILVANIIIKGTEHIPTLIIFSVALAISVVPEALPVVTTFSFSRGALHLAKHKVVVKRLSAIEDLGSIEVLCTDKTGTITENQLTVSDINGHQETIFYACLATPFHKKEQTSFDPFDIALLNKLPQEKKEKLQSYETIDEIPFDPQRRRNTVLVTNKTEKELISRGAFENIFPLCKKNSTITSVQKWIDQQGEQGKRVLAIAKKTVNTDRAEKQEEKDMEFLGLISFIDPLKKTSHQAIAQAKKLQVDIKILTGDSKEVAGAVAYQIGLIADPHTVITGEEFDAFNQEKQHEAMEKFSVFARVSPEQKHNIVQLLQKTHEVGFLGEGINDAPALKAANVALVVEGASDIARETADIVLLNKSLQVIIDGITEGREIFSNTAKYIKATLASNFGNFYTVALSSLFIPFLPLLPLQILLINLLTDFPMIAVATDKVDKDDLRRPKNYNVKEIAIFATVMGIVSSLFDFLFFLFFYKVSPGVLQTNWFIGSVLTELLFLFSIRSRFFILRAVPPSFTLIFLSGIVFIITLILPFTYFGQTIFSFIAPRTQDMYIILGITISYFIVTELVKNMYYALMNKIVKHGITSDAIINR